MRKLIDQTYHHADMQHQGGAASQAGAKRAAEEALAAVDARLSTLERDAARMREAATRAQLAFNHMIYVADKNGDADCRIAVALASIVEADLRAALAPSPETSE